MEEKLKNHVEILDARAVRPHSNGTSLFKEIVLSLSVQGLFVDQNLMLGSGNPSAIIESVHLS